MSDGSRLRDSWTSALNHVQTQFRSLLTGSSSSSWKRIAVPSSSADSAKNATTNLSTKGKAKALPHVSDVIVHRKVAKGGEVIRLVLDVTAEDGLQSLDAWKAVLGTPELRKEWDPTVEAAHIIEMFDPETRISKTDFALGWPVNPRDAITISRTFTDANTLIDIGTSLPRSPDEPAYLRPTPPYVRSHVHLFAWCIQLLPHSHNDSGKASNPSPRVRVTCFWQHDLKAMWGASSLSQNLPAMVIGLVHTVRKRGERIPILRGWGKGVGLDNVSFASGREALRVDYSIIAEDEDVDAVSQSTNDLRTLKERKRLERSIEVIVPIINGWEIQISTRASSEETERLPWTLHATKITLPPPPNSSEGPLTTGLVAIRLTHPCPYGHSVLKVKITIELANAVKGLRVNGSPHPISDSESRDPVAFTMSAQMLQDASTVSDISLATSSTSGSTKSGTSLDRKPTLTRTSSDRSQAADKAILTLVRRNYIYFTSLLQEPEAKWRPVTEARGVTITQLDSIDPTLVVYRAEAVFVGVGLWDLLSTVKTPGAQVHWNKSHDDAVLLEDVNELTELWHHTTKAAWPVNARDNVLLTTEYKSPTSAHVFSFSTDDRQLFPSIHPPDMNVIRTQVDLRGWAIEALSPNTTLLTLLDQSDPKGWSNKSSIPQQMIATLAGVGDFAIKSGGPPVATRVGGAKIMSVGYDHEKGSFKLVYEGSESRRSSALGPLVDVTSNASNIDLLSPEPPALLPSNTVTNPTATMPRIECQLRCDVDTWAPSLALVVDPPPQTISCFKRHRLSTGGGGLWITIEHDATFIGEERLQVSVRKGTATSGKDKNVVFVNGSKVRVDMEDLPESEVKLLAKQRRVRPVRIPLDQPPVAGVIRRRKVEWDEEEKGDNAQSASPATFGAKLFPGASTPRLSSPWARMFTVAMEQTINTTSAATAVFTPATYATPLTPVSSTSSNAPSKPPMQHALEALSYLQAYHSKSSDDGWTIASDKGPMLVTKNIDPSLSTTIPIHRAQKVIEGVSAGEISIAITTQANRRVWDDRFTSYAPLEEYGNGCSTSFISSRCGFPFRDRGFWVASVLARLNSNSPGEGEPRGRSSGDNDSASPVHTSTIFIASSSFNPSTSPTAFSAAKVNPSTLPIGHLIMSGWILETVDPYMPEQNYPIPSTKCTHFVAVDYRGSVPVAFNTSMNATLPRAEILALEAWLRNNGGLVVGPSVRYPPVGLSVEATPTPSSPATQVKEKENESQTEDAWALIQPEDDRTTLFTKFDPSSKVYNARIMIDKSAITLPVTDYFTTPRPSTQTTPQPRRVGSFMFPMSPAASSPQRARSPSSSSIPSTSTVKDRRPSNTATRSQTAIHQRMASSPSRSQTMLARELRHSTSSSSSLASEALSDKPTGDLIVAEFVVDPYLYKDGYKIDTHTEFQPDRLGDSLLLGFGPPLSINSVASPSTPNPFLAAIPLTFTIYTIPASPLLSTTSDKPTSRHLVRALLPTAEYYMPPIEDPLSGELRKPPPPPPWLVELESRGALVDISISPANKTVSTSSKVHSKAMVDGKDVPIVSEKKSVSFLGREYLEDDKLWSCPALRSVKTSEGTSRLPMALTQPLAVSSELVENSKPSLGLDILPEQPLTDEPQSMEPGDAADAISARTPIVPGDTPLPDTGSAVGNGFFTFWNASTSLFSIGKTTTPLPPTENDKPELASTTDAKDVVDLAENTAQPDLSTVTATTTEPTDPLHTATALLSRQYFPISALLIVAIISFLFGSLFRSLLSPADFIYFTSNSGEEVHGPLPDGATGWREVKRLLEFKYGLFGWDFVVAVVRRRPPNIP